MPSEERVIVGELDAIEFHFRPDEPIPVNEEVEFGLDLGVDGVELVAPLDLSVLPVTLKPRPEFTLDGRVGTRAIVVVLLAAQLRPRRCRAHRHDDHQGAQGYETAAIRVHAHVSPKEFAALCPTRRMSSMLIRLEDI
jgi:hypothetical protein